MGRDRRADAGHFDMAWDDARGSQPIWLRYLEHDRSVADQVHRWLMYQPLEEEEAFLAANPQLVSEETEAVLDHLIDDNPGNRWLHVHRDIIRAARAQSIEYAYAQHRELVWREGTARAIAAWISAAEEELQGVLAEERALLLSDEAAKQAEDMLATSMRTPDLIWRIGLLTLCRCDGAQAAFQISDDLEALRRPPGRRALTELRPRDLAMARIRAGRDPDDPEAAFVHAVLALAVGHAGEAGEAITRCAKTSTSWDRRARAADLTELTAIRPDLEAGLTWLRSIMAVSDHATAAAPRSP